MAAPINVPAYSDALVVLGTAGILVPLLSRFGLSPVVGYLGAGAALGPLGLGSFIADAPLLYWLTVVDAKNVAGIADLGVVFLLFLIGLELSFERLKTMRRLVFGLGGLQIAISSTLIAGIAVALGLSGPASIIIGVSLALSSTAIVLEVLSSEDRLATTAGRTSFSILLAQDLAVIPMLIFISLLGANAGGSVLSNIGTALLQAVIAITIIIVVGRVMLRPLFRLVASTRSNEMFIAATLFVVVATGFVAATAGLSMAFGAFIAGLLLAGTEYRRAIEATIEPFKGLLLGMFFFTVGMSIDIREVMREPLWIIASVFGLIAAKAAIVLLIARLYRITRPTAVEAALLLGPGGEFAFVGIGLATTLGILSREVSNFTLTVTSLSMTLIPALAILGRRIASSMQSVDRAAPELLSAPTHLAGHAIVVGYGRMGKVVCDLFRRHDIAFVAIDHDAGSVADDRSNGHDVHFGDATHPAFLNACGLSNAASVVITIQSQTVADAIIAQVRIMRPDIPIVARARDSDHARHLYAMGVSDAVPETVEASLQLSQAALLGMGVPLAPVAASIDAKREAFRQTMQQADSTAGTKAGSPAPK
ncbi:MAG: cation:proton antiporter [Hyphomicrobiaceae bacterium]|nr:cation:proton antiporter [Hyphomicrobiaceae bacterium]